MAIPRVVRASIIGPEARSCRWFVTLTHIPVLPVRPRDRQYAKSEDYRDELIFYFRPNHCLLLAQNRDSVPAMAMQKALSNEKCYIMPRVGTSAS